ncbi:MAG: SPOR domain-containing protein [Parvibaculum sp.]|nr:SPOR domain-containing protein [Parvibaculum sp.]
MPNRDGHWDEDPEYDFDPDVEDYEVYDDEEGRRRGPLMLLSVVALLVVFAGVVFLAYRQGDTGGAIPPLLRADGEPTKEVPANPGGKKFPHQDAGIYDRIGGEAAGRGEGEQLLPPAEEPLAIDRPSEISPRDQQAMDRLAQAIESAPLEPIVPGAPQAEPVTADSPAPEAPAETAPPPVASNTGTHVVQLAAFRDEAAARDAFEKLRTKFPDLLGPLVIDIQRADLGEQGIYYRLRGGYLEKAAADALCSQLDAQGQGCFVRPR